MEEQRPRNHFQDQVRQIPCAAHRQGHQGQRRPERDEPQTRSTTTGHVAVCARSKRSRSTKHKPRRATREPIPTIRRDGAQYYPAIAQSVCAPSVAASSQSPFRAHGLQPIIAQRCLAHVTISNLEAGLRRLNRRRILSKDRPSYLHIRDDSARATYRAHGHRPYDIFPTKQPCTTSSRRVRPCKLLPEPYVSSTPSPRATTSKPIPITSTTPSASEATETILKLHSHSTTISKRFYVARGVSATVPTTKRFLAASSATILVDISPESVRPSTRTSSTAAAVIAGSVQRR